MKFLLNYLRINGHISTQFSPKVHELSLKLRKVVVTVSVARHTKEIVFIFVAINACQHLYSKSSSTCNVLLLFISHVKSVFCNYIIHTSSEILDFGPFLFKRSQRLKLINIISAAPKPLDFETPDWCSGNIIHSQFLLLTLVCEMVMSSKNQTEKILTTIVQCKRFESDL